VLPVFSVDVSVRSTYQKLQRVAIKYGHFNVLIWMHMNDIISDQSHEYLQLVAITFGKIKILISLEIG
jgi:hypothetical protein